MFSIKLSKILLWLLCLCGALGFSQANITVSKTHPRYFEKNGERGFLLAPTICLSKTLKKLKNTLNTCRKWRKCDAYMGSTDF